MTDLTKTDWRAIARRIQRGKCTPIIGSSFYTKLLPKYDCLLSSWAKEIDYPLGNDHKLTRLAQYLSVSVGDHAAKEEYLTFIKAYAIAQNSKLPTHKIIDKYGTRLLDVPLSKVVNKLGYLVNNQSQKDPITKLATLPIPIFITTSYYNFIEIALTRLQKRPYTDVCLWLDSQLKQMKERPNCSLPDLKKLMLQYFNNSELQDACFELSVDFESLEGSGKANKIRELILHMQRHNRLCDLIEFGKQSRPHLRWPDISRAMSRELEGQTAVSSSIFRQNANYHPTSREPLIYYLFGKETDPQSIVLTEDNHLDFLMRISQEKRLIPPIVAQSLEDSSLLLMGYRIDDWDFRALFRGLIASRRGSRREINVAIQLEPDQYSKKAQNYLEHYFQEVEFKVYWGSSQAFLNNIARYLR